jgi:exodeoxyribonuclease VII large subunit
VLHRRCPNLRILVVPVQVQGEGSAEQIAEAVRVLNEMDQVDVIIVGRGGGSLEDLWSFNDERVVRAIAASRIPVVSAVGHETDVTLADFAADARAPTPSAAAEVAVPVLCEVHDRSGELDRRCRQAVARRCADERRRLALCFAHLARMRYTVLDAAQRVDGAVLRITQTVQDQVRRGRDQVHSMTHRLMASGPQALVHHGLAVVPHMSARLCGVMGHQLDRRRREIRACMDHLHHLSPLAILSRGYSIVETLPDRRVVHEAPQVTVGQDVLARLAHGQLRCTVQERIPDSRFENRQ